MTITIFTSVVNNCFINIKRLGHEMYKAEVLNLTTKEQQVRYVRSKTRAMQWAIAYAEEEA